MPFSFKSSYCDWSSNIMRIGALPSWYFTSECLQSWSLTVMLLARKPARQSEHGLAWRKTSRAKLPRNKQLNHSATLPSWWERIPQRSGRDKKVNTPIRGWTPTPSGAPNRTQKVTGTPLWKGTQPEKRRLCKRGTKTGTPEGWHAPLEGPRVTQDPGLRDKPNTGPPIWTQHRPREHPLQFDTPACKSTGQYWRGPRKA